MSETTAAPNNKPVAFGAKPDREMSGAGKPPKSIRKKANRAIKRGMISPKAAAKHLKDY